LTIFYLPRSRILNYQPLSFENKKINAREKSITDRVINMLQEDWEVNISHVFREANRCADKLANMGSAGSTELVLYDYPPSEVALVAFDDFRGVSLPRLISL
jgi:L1 cell adhesion molecule like protein